MPRAYLLAVSSGSSVDRDTANVSLFHLIEQVELPELPPNLRLQLELHAYWEVAPDELGAELECRFLLTRDGRPAGEPSPPIRFRPDAPRVHARAIGLPVPGLGAHRLGIEWRRKGDEPWIREPAQWPITFAIREL
jgi:hypothetical protein